MMSALTYDQTLKVPRELSTYIKCLLKGTGGCKIGDTFYDGLTLPENVIAMLESMMGTQNHDLNQRINALAANGDEFSSFMSLVNEMADIFPEDSELAIAALERWYQKSVKKLADLHGQLKNAFDDIRHGGVATEAVNEMQYTSKAFTDEAKAFAKQADQTEKGGETLLNAAVQDQANAMAADARDLKWTQGVDEKGLEDFKEEVEKMLTEREKYLNTEVVAASREPVKSNASKIAYFKEVNKTLDNLQATIQQVLMNFIPADEFRDANERLLDFEHDVKATAKEASQTLNGHIRTTTADLLRDYQSLARRTEHFRGELPYRVPKMDTNLAATTSELATARNAKVEAAIGATSRDLKQTINERVRTFLVDAVSQMYRLADPRQIHQVRALNQEYD
jgi:hypothetical protein